MTPMNYTQMPTLNLVELARRKAVNGHVEGDLLAELQTRYAYQNCPPADQAYIEQLDRTSFQPLYGRTKLPPRSISVNSAAPAPVPIYYQRHNNTSNLPNLTLKSLHKPGNKVTVFVASSSEAKSQAKALIRDLVHDGISFLPWWESVRPGRTFLSELEAIGQRVGAALFVFSPDIDGDVRGKRVSLPNQNVLFELGYFWNLVTPERLAIVRYGNTTLPTDLAGYTHITGSKFFKPGSAASAGKKTKSDFNRWADGLFEGSPH